MHTTRPYKTDTPLRTVSRIRNILSDLDCCVYESKWGNPYEGVYSVRVETDVCDGRFGTNGKGRTRLYCLASAYAEFMERIQNGLLAGRSFSRLFLEDIKTQTGFYYFPDERFISRSEFEDLPDDYLSDVFSNDTRVKSAETYFARLAENGYPGCIAVPFYDVRRRRIVYFPHNISQTMSGSNGMAAGNDVAEGLFQGLCELLERYGSAEVYSKQLTPPTVPRQYLKRFPSELEIIRRIEEDGTYEVVVKDFSAGRRLPVLGVMIKSREKRTYRLNVGSETSFAVALSRCLTELYQGIQTKDDTERAMLPIPETTPDYFLKDDEESRRLRNEQFLKFTMNGSGLFPSSLFDASESYPFDPTVFTPADSYTHECQALLQRLLEAGHDVYLRNVSFLGFPSVYIYVPSVSPVGKKTETGAHKINFKTLTNLDRVEDFFFPFEQLPMDRLEKLAGLLDAPLDARMKDRLKLEFLEKSDWHGIPCSFFLTMVWFQLGRLDDAIRNLKRFIKSSKNEESQYFRTVIRFLELKAAGKGDGAVQETLRKDGFDETEVAQIVAGFSDPSRLYESIGIPRCPNCDQCTLASDCLTKRKLDFTKRINMAMRHNHVSQEELEVFAPEHVYA